MFGNQISKLKELLGSETVWLLENHWNVAAGGLEGCFTSGQTASDYD